MKKAILVLSMSVSALFTLGQSGVIPPENVDPFGARDLCGKETYAQLVDLETTSLPCLKSQVKLFYHFRTPSAATGLSIGTLTTSTSSEYAIFGPFESVQQGAAMINQNLAAGIAYGSASTSHTLSINSEENGVYIMAVKLLRCDGSVSFALQTRNMSCSVPVTCQSCLPSFGPGAGNYVISAWVKEASAAPTKTSYDRPSIEISFPSQSLSYSFTPTGQIIDGWQRIESIFESPGGQMSLQLRVSSGDAFFDDIRIFPFEGSMISYVYDPLTLRLVAELDERNYAKIYEYDEEGKLTRVKKETEKGIMTIQENRENSVKKP